jgi:omega-amidase
MIVACCQLDVAWEDKGANYAKVRALVKTNPPPPGSLLLLPEMFATGFSMDVARIAEDAGRATESFLASLARELGVCVVGGLVSIQDDGRGRNEAVVFDPEGRELARYCKLHPFSFGGEDRHYAAGAEVVTFDWAGVRVAPFICYDLRFPEVFRSAVRREAQLYAVIANWPSAREAHWSALLRARAIENQAYVAGVNRCGADPRLAYSGRSLIFDPRGECLAEADGREGLIHAPVDLPALLDYRKAFPALADMR